MGSAMRLGIESRALIPNPDDQCRRAIDRIGFEFDEDVFGGVALVAVLDGVDDAIRGPPRLSSGSILRRAPNSRAT